MEIEIKKSLFDIKTSIDSVFEYLQKVDTLEKFQNSKITRRAVEREIEIIGEAMSRILKINPDINIENARKIVDTRNWVIHGYDSVDEIIIWGVLTTHLPKLQQEIEKLLQQDD